MSGGKIIRPPNMQSRIITPGELAKGAVALTDNEIRLRYKEQIQELGRLSSIIIKLTKQRDDLEQEKGMASLDHLNEREALIEALRASITEMTNQTAVHVRLIEFLKNTLAQMIDEIDAVYPVKDKGQFDPVEIVAELVKKVESYRDLLSDINHGYPVEDMDKCDLVDLIKRLQGVTNAVDTEESTGRGEELDEGREAEVREGG